MQSQLHLAEAKLAQHGISLPKSADQAALNVELDQAKSDHADAQYKYERVISVAQEVRQRTALQPVRDSTLLLQTIQSLQSLLSQKETDVTAARTEASTLNTRLSALQAKHQSEMTKLDKKYSARKVRDLLAVGFFCL